MNKKSQRKKRKRKERNRARQFKKSGTGMFTHNGKEYFGSYDLTIGDSDEPTCSNCGAYKDDPNSEMCATCRGW